MRLTGTKFFALDYAVVEAKYVKLVWRLPNYCNVASWRNNLINLTHYDETRKRAHDSHRYFQVELRWDQLQISEVEFHMEHALDEAILI